MTRRLFSEQFHYIYSTCNYNLLHAARLTVGGMNILGKVSRRCAYHEWSQNYTISSQNGNDQWSYQAGVVTCERNCRLLTPLASHLKKAYEIETSGSGGMVL